jgi:peptide/nickel transport system permease protein
MMSETQQGSTVILPPNLPFEVTVVPSRFPGRRLNTSKKGLLRSAVSTLVAIFGVLTIVFFAIMVTGNPAVLLASPSATHEEIAALTRLYGFDKSLAEQYIKFLWNIVSGNYPNSLRLGSSPLEQILPAIPFTLTLTFAASLISIVIGLFVGYLSVFSRYKVLREIPLNTLAVFQATPVFVVGLFFVLIFSIHLGWLPTGGSGTFRSLVLPSLSLALMFSARIAQVFRASLLQAVSAEHVRSAKTRQISLWTIRFRHIVVNALLPVISVIGLEVGSLLGGSVITESLFSRPGIGTVLLIAIDNKDYPVIIAAVVLISAIFIVINTLVDIVSVIVDPRAEASI